MNLFEHIKQLHDSELYLDLKQLVCIVLTLCENSTEVEVLSLPQKYQSMVFYGNALYQLGEYKKAEEMYTRALLLKKAINRTKGKTATPQTQADVTTEVDVKYKIYLCLSQMKQFREAMTMLEGISTKQRNAKINLALAKLYLRTGMDRSAITSYKEVLRECPMALEAVSGLLSLGVKGADVIALVMNGMPHGTTCDWLTMWIRGQACMTSQEYHHALTMYRSMDSKLYIKDNIYLLTSLAQVLFYDGQYSQALLAFQRAHALDPLHLKHMDLYSYLLAKEKKIPELQRLSQQLMAVTEHAPEPWIAIGYFSMVTKRAVKAVYFAQKANNLDPCNVEPFLLKGAGLLEIKKTQEALLHFQEAVRLAPHRYEAYLGLIDCYVANNRVRDALNWAGKAIKTLGTNVRTLTLYASVIVKDRNTVSKAKPYLQKAMNADPNYLEPVYIMAEILAHEHQYDKGIELLRKQLQTHSTCRLHQMLADFLTHTNEHQEALEEYNKALGLDPSNTRAREGMERVEKTSDMGLDSAYEVEVEDMDNSDNDADFDASDVESNWSETDFS